MVQRRDSERSTKILILEKMRTYSGIVENGDESVTNDVIEDWAMDDGWDLDTLDVYSRLVYTDGYSVDFEFTAQPPANFSDSMAEASLGMLSLLIEKAHRGLSGEDAYVQWTSKY